MLALAAAQTKTDTHEQQIKADKRDSENSDLRARLASSAEDAQIKADKRDSENSNLRARLASSEENAAARLRRSESQLDAAQITAGTRDSDIQNLRARLASSEQALRRSEDASRDTESELTGYLEVAKAENTRLLQDIHRLEARIGRGPPVSHGSSGGYHYTCGESPLGFAFDRDGDERNWPVPTNHGMSFKDRPAMFESSSTAAAGCDCGLRLGRRCDRGEEPELRVARDGQLYSRRHFAEYYSDSTEEGREAWEEAPSVEGPPVAGGRRLG